MASLFLLLASLSFSFLCICQADLISDVCSKAAKRPLCIQTLSSDPRSRGANLTTLGLIAIDKSQAATHDFIKVVSASSTEKTKDIVRMCVETSNGAIHDLITVGKDLKSYSPIKKDLKEAIQIVGSGALMDVGTCDYMFDILFAVAEPSNVRVASKRAQDIIRILLAVANAL